MKYAVIVTVWCLGLALVGCPHLRVPEGGPGGLNVGDFEKVSLNGFDAADQAADLNDYAWSMAAFAADGAARDFLYVGTWNRVQQWKGFQKHLPVYPEIRRYRPDISPTAWETVLDTRDLSIPVHERPDGFRNMQVYRNQSDGKSYLYAGGRGETTSLWRSATGEPGSWERFWFMDREGSIRGMTVHHGLLYMAFYNDYAMLGDKASGGEKASEPLILATDGQDVWTASSDGFGNPNNVGIFTVQSFNGWLYAGTHNPTDGCEVWKLAGPDANAAPVKVFDHGGGRWLNEAAMTMFVYQDHMYIGTQASFIWRMIGGLKAADTFRIDAQDRVEVVAGPKSVGGEASGFGEKGNAYVWSFCEHDGWLYAGTYDIVTGLTYMLTHPEYLAGMMGLDLDFKFEPVNEKCLTGFDLITLQPNAGADLYKSQDGAHWYAVTVDGFGHQNNYGFRTMQSFDGKLFVGTANPYDGLEIWAGKASGQ
jgi:hypothetical protein